jgi:hypothetical protein
MIATNRLVTVAPDTQIPASRSERAHHRHQVPRQFVLHVHVGRRTEALPILVNRILCKTRGSGQVDRDH